MAPRRMGVGNYPSLIWKEVGWRAKLTVDAPVSMTLRSSWKVVALLGVMVRELLKYPTLTGQMPLVMVPSWGS